MIEDHGMCISCPSNLGALRSLRTDDACHEQDSTKYDRHEVLDLSQEETRDGFGLSRNDCRPKRSESVSTYRPKFPKFPFISRSNSTGPHASSSSPNRKKSRAHSPIRSQPCPDLFAQVHVQSPVSPMVGGWVATSTVPTMPLNNEEKIKENRMIRRSNSQTESLSTDGVHVPHMRRSVSYPQASASEDLQEKVKKLKCFKDRESLMECISAETVAEILGGADHIRALYDRVIIIDCRFQYEYDGGHLRVPPHLAHWVEVLHIPPHESQTAMDIFFNGGGTRGLPVIRVDQDRVCAIFHCEFSQKRAPEMCQKIRGEDRRRIGSDGYPKLHYPEMYILSMGYKNFWQTFPTLCHPPNYVAERDERFAEECLFFNKARKTTNLKKKMGRSGRDLQSYNTLRPMGEIPTDFGRTP